MDAMARRMEILEDFARPVGAQAAVISSTSGEGEGEAGVGSYTFTARRKNRRKTITLNESQRLPLGSQSLSESAFNTPSPSPFQAALPPSQLRLQTSFNPVDYSAAIPSVTGTSSPRRASGRSTVTSSPVKKHGGVVLGTNMADANIIAGDELKEMERGRGRGIPRTLTLPAHLTESLMMMKITRDGSTEVMGTHTETEGQRSVGLADMDVDGMEIDATQPRKAALRVVMGSRDAGQAMRVEQEDPPSSPRKSKRRRARSLPPRPTKANEDDECDADDEGGGPRQEDDDNDAGLFSPITPQRRGRRDTVGTDAGNPSMQSMQGMVSGMAPIGTGVLRRSARRVKPVTGTGIAFGGPNPFLKGIAEAEAGSGMEGIDVVKNAPRKRARTREGGERDRERGRDEEGRATKRTRKR